MLKKLKKSKQLKDSQLLKLILLADNKDFLDNDKHQPELITLKKEKLIGLPYIVLMDLFNCSMPMFGTQNSWERMLQFLDMFLWLLTCTCQAVKTDIAKK